MYDQDIAEKADIVFDSDYVMETSDNKIYTIPNVEILIVNIRE